MGKEAALRDGALAEKSINRQLRGSAVKNIIKTGHEAGAHGAVNSGVTAATMSGIMNIVSVIKGEKRRIRPLGTAGTALLAGEVGVAAGLAGSALTFGAAMTPLAVIAAPVVLFTGISASLKADENLEKANTMYAQAEAASEKMKISETLCNAIADRSNMFHHLLSELNGMFSECTGLLDEITRKKTGRFKNKRIGAFYARAFICNTFIMGAMALRWWRYWQ